MSKARIVERTLPSGNKEYVIQQRHFLFWWVWVDAWLNTGGEDTYTTQVEAERNLYRFNGTKSIDRVVWK